ncbi:MAG: hypothetical protein LZF62_380017 [Nitrospira sp.]|nr:MAG: hypothetical protein LZF62_380017 [Nitrospira sp.]
MTEVGKNEASIAALKSAGYEKIRLKVVPKVFLFNDGSCRSELEFSRTYFGDMALVSLEGLMRDKILPAIRQHLG